MEDQKVLDVIGIYLDYFEDRNIPKVKHPHNKLAPNEQDLVLAHCHNMVSGVEEFIISKDRDKRDRALKRAGFIEGCLWTTRQFTVAQLKELNCPDEGTINPKTNEPLSYEDLQDWEY